MMAMPLTASHVLTVKSNHLGAGSESTMQYRTCKNRHRLESSRKLFCPGTSQLYHCSTYTYYIYIYIHICPAALGGILNLIREAFEIQSYVR